MIRPEPTFVGVDMATSDGTKELVAAPGAGLTTFVTAIHWTVVTAAAQLVKVGKSAGTAAQQVLELAASASGTGTRTFGGRGFPLPINTALTAVPASAGPAVHFIVEYYTHPAIT